MQQSNAERVAGLDKRFAVVTIGSRTRQTVVAEFTTDQRICGLHKFPDFKNYLIHEPPVAVGTGFVSMATYWLRQTQHRYNRLVFAPPGTRAVVRPEDFNTWYGLAVEPAREPDDGKWELIRYHILEVICGGDERLESWLHNWMAAMVQKPGQHGMVALLLMGPQGNGKSIFIDKILGGLFHGQNYVHLTNPKHLTGEFNSLLEDKVLVFADEALWADKNDADRLKGLITEDTVTINRKHVPQEIQDSALHIAIASNADKPLHVEPTDRRLAVFEVSDRHLQDQCYFGQLIGEIENGGREAFLRYLMDYGVDWQMTRTAPDTAAKRALKSASLAPFERWWLDVLMNTDDEEWHDTWETQIANPDVFARYAKWFERSGTKAAKLTEDALGKQFAKHFRAAAMPEWPRKAGRADFINADGKERRAHAKRFPSLMECRAAFDRVTRTQQEWPEDDEPDALTVQRPAA